MTEGGGALAAARLSRCIGVPPVVHQKEDGVTAVVEMEEGKGGEGGKEMNRVVASS
jgi:hypothetical protein